MLTSLFTLWSEHSSMKQQKHFILLNISLLCLVMKVMKKADSYHMTVLVTAQSVVTSLFTAAIISEGMEELAKEANDC